MSFQNVRKIKIIDEQDISLDNGLLRLIERLQKLAKTGDKSGMNKTEKGVVIGATAGAVVGGMTVGIRYNQG